MSTESKPGTATDCVKVAVRVRPFIQSEINRGCEQVVEKIRDLPQLRVTGETTSKTQDSYSFNNVFMPKKTQEEVYHNSVQPIICKLFEGYNVTILAYGQTGSGKTYTMGTCFEGDWNDPKTGIIPRALRDIFETIREKKDQTITTSCNFMELYQENLYDLLSGKIKDQSMCEIREDNQKGIIITGLTEVNIENEEHAARYLMEGGENRTVGATAMNNVSSRSHAIFTVNFKVVDSNGAKTSSKFHLVDLAGSERSKKTLATGKRFKEGVKINQGLLALGNVISALGGGQGASVNGFISYRDSKLTRLLQDSLGGNSVTLMIACVSPADYNIEETLSTLRYADRAKKIKNKPVKNLDARDQEIERIKLLLKSMTRRALVAESKVFELGGNDALLMLQEINIDEHDEVLEMPESLETSIRAGASRVVVHECGETCKKQKLEKDIEIKDLRKQMSSIITTFSNVQHTRINEESCHAELMERFEQLVELVFTTCPAEFATPETTIFKDIEVITKSIEQIIKNFKEQQNSGADEDFKFEDSNHDDVEGNRRRVEYTQAQMASLIQIKMLEQEMKIKQDLLNRKCENQASVNDDTDNQIDDLRSKIQNLEKELDDIRSSSMAVTVRRDQNATKVNMERKHKIEKLEKELINMKKKCLCLENFKKLAESDRKRIEDLKKELTSMKQARVSLIRLQRTEGDQYKKWIKNRDKEINTLKEKGRKQQNEMKRIERMHEKQQSVLKRKVEEGKAANKRLQDAMDRNKKVQEMRKTNKKSVEKPQEVIQNYIDHEVMVLITTIDAKVAMQNLINDSRLLMERLINLKCIVNKTELIENEMKQIEQELEMRNTQIGDIRAKILETDIEAKLKIIPDNFKTLPELRTAMGYILRGLLDAREEYSDLKTKIEDLRVIYEASEERSDQLTEEMQKMKEENEIAKSTMEREFETKFAFLNVHNKEDLEQPNWEDKSRKEIKHQLKWMTQQICNKTTEIQDLNAKLLKFEQEIDRLQNSKNAKKEKKHSDGTFTVVDESDEDNRDDSDDLNDSLNDPEWRKTPAGKRMKARRTMTLMKESFTNRMDGTGMLANISESSEGSGAKRSFNGQLRCKCKGSCATRLCKCKKSGNFCNDTCKCSNACINCPDDSKESDGGAAESLVVKKENLEGSDAAESPKRAKMDFNNITTPYYPYQSKKRKPLLQI